MTTRRLQTIARRDAEQGARMKASGILARRVPARSFQRPAAPTRGRALATLFFAVVLTVVAAGYAVFEFERERVHDAAINYLTGVLESKQRQISAWRRDRLNELNLLAGTRPSRETVRAALEGDAAAVERLRQHFTPLVTTHRYDSVYLVDTQGRLRNQLGTAPSLPPEFSDRVRAVLATGEPQIIDTLTSGEHPQVRFHLLTVVPGSDPRTPAGILGVQIDPGYFFEPIIFAWPVPRSTGEVLLMRPAGKQVRFLTSPRAGRAGMVMSARDAGVAARALLQRGAFEGIDHRGQPVLVVADQVPETPWRLLIKIDQAEVYVSIRELALWIMVVTIVVIAAAAGLTFLWWRAERERFQLDAAREREALARHFDYLAKYANDIIFLADETGRILEVNDRALDVYGFTRDELLHMRVTDLRIPEDRAGFERQWSQIGRDKAAVYEVRHLTKDGRVIPLEASTRVIEVEGRVYYQAICRDISERKLAEKKLQRANNLYAALSQTNEAVARMKDPQALFAEICRIAVDAGRLIDAWAARWDRESHSLVGIAHAGAHADYFLSRRLRVDPDSPTSVGLSVCALRTGDVCVSNHFATDPRTRHWRGIAESFGVRAAASLPVREEDQIIGVLSVYSADRDYFDEHTLSLLREITAAVSFALENFRREELRAQAEKATRESEYRYRQLIDNMSPGMVVIEAVDNAADFVVRDVNCAFDRIEKQDRKNVLGRRLSEILPEARERSLLATLARVWRTGNPESVEFEVQTGQAAGWRDIYVYRLPIGDVVAVYDDITQSKQAERRLRQSEERFALVLQGVNDGYWDFDFESHDYHFSQRFAEMFGYDAEDMAHIAEAWVALVHPDDRDMVDAALEAHLEGKTPRYESEHRMLRKDGNVIWVHARGTVVRRDADGKALRMTGTHRDITDRKREENQLRLWATVFEHSRDGIFITDSERKIISSNAAITEMTGYAIEEMVGRDPRMFSSGEQSRAFYQNMWAAINGGGYWQGEIRDRRKSGEIFPLYTSITATRDAQGDVQNYIAICTDISERKAAEERIRFLAHHDVLTGLPNRALLEDRLDQALAHARRTETRLGVLFVDLDRFKNINDSLGHHLGDELLKLVGQRLRSCVRVDDSVSRQGGDEFVLVVTELEDASDAGQVAQKVIEAISEPFSLDGSEIHITPSIGISIYPEDGSDGETLIRNADAAMYFAKERGRNNFQFFIQELNLRALRRISIETALRRAIDQGEFVLHYQPQVNIWSDKLVGVEALIRWQREDRLILPNEFIPIAEETGLIFPIGEWVLQEACSQQKRWATAGLSPVTMAVNFSAAQFHQKEILTVVKKIVSRDCADPTRLEVELTEGMIMEDAEASIAILAALKDMGMTLAIDDFGTGYSSLNYLRRFRIDRLKVDQSFVHDLDKDPADRAITEAIIAMGKSLGLRVIAEGVERREEIDLLKESRCDELQGFFFSPPLPSDRFLQWWRTRTQGSEGPAR